MLKKGRTIITKRTQIKNAIRPILFKVHAKNEECIHIFKEDFEKIKNLVASEL